MRSEKCYKHESRMIQYEWRWNPPWRSWEGFSIVTFEEKKIITKYCNPIIPIIAFLIGSSFFPPVSQYCRVPAKEKKIEIFWMLYNVFSDCNLYIIYTLNISYYIMHFYFLFTHICVRGHMHSICSYLSSTFLCARHCARLIVRF